MEIVDVGYGFWVAVEWWGGELREILIIYEYEYDDDDDHYNDDNK